METSPKRKGDSSLLKGVYYFPSRSMVDGFAVALLSRCQLKKNKETLCVSWLEYAWCYYIKMCLTCVDFSLTEVGVSSGDQAATIMVMVMLNYCNNVSVERL